MTDQRQEAPERIWLQIDPMGDTDDKSYPPDHGDVTWCWHSIGGSEIEYVRSDIAATQSARIAELEAEVERLRVDAERLDCLESLTQRSAGSDLHMFGGRGRAAIYVRTGISGRIEASGSGSVRQAIDSVRAKQAGGGASA